MIAPPRGGVRPGLVALFLFGSGLCALVYQTVWLRELRDVFGASTAATAAVVGIFMAGLGFGGLRLGRFADRSSAPLNLYAMLELGVCAAAGLTLLLLPVVEWIYWSTGGTVALGVGGATVLRLVLAVALLGPATFLMGGTLPAAARSIVGENDTRRRSLAMLYGINTVGAVAGAVVSTFFLLETFGNRRSLLFAVLVNALVVVAARAHSRNAGEDGEVPQAEDEPAPESAGLRVSRPFVLGSAVVTGFVFMLMEIVWYRILAPLLGGSTFTFGVILALALAGIGLGGLAYSVFETRGEVSARLFGLTCALEALALAIPFALGDRIALFAVFLQPMDAFGFAGRIIGWALIAAVVVLPASMIAGFQFPLLISLAGRARAHLGRDVGQVYAFNTAGAILGSLSGGFGLIPLLSAEGCWTLCIWVMVGLSLASMLEGLRSREWSYAGIAVVALTIVLVLPAEGPTAAWRHSPIGAGRVRMSFETQAEIENWRRERRRSVVWERDGVESAVAVVGSSGYAFVINGKTDGHSTGDAGTQVMGGLIGAIQHERPSTSLVIGLGTGSTAGWLASVPGMERVDVAELEPGVLEVARYCTPVNENVLDRKNVNIFLGDAREILLASDRKYDLIFSEPSNPYRAGIASLFTREFYEASRDRLNDGGLFMQWVQGYEVTPSTLETIFATVKEVYPYIQIWETLEKDNVLVGATRPLPVRADVIARRLTEEPYSRAAAAAWKVTTAEQFMAHFVADQRLIDGAVDLEHVEINTDDRNVVEFGFARSVGRSSALGPANLRDIARRLGVDGPAGGSGDVAMIRRQTLTSPLLTSATIDRQGPLYHSVQAYKGRDYSRAVELWDAAGVEPESHPEALLLAHSLAEIGSDRCEPAAERLASYSVVEAEFVRAICECERDAGDPSRAAKMFHEAYVALRTDPWVNAELAMTALFRLEAIEARLPTEERLLLADAISQPFAVSMIDGSRRSVALRVAYAAESGRCGERTVGLLHGLEPHVPWLEDLLRLRADCYASVGDPLADRARRESLEYQLQIVEPFGSRFTRRPAE